MESWALNREIIIELNELYCFLRADHDPDPDFLPSKSSRIGTRLINLMIEQKKEIAAQDQEMADQ